jgi:hypothetical protein
VIHVVTAGIAAKGESNMTTLITEAAGAAQKTVSEKPKAGKKARVAAERAHVAPKKGKAASKAKSSTKPPAATHKARLARDGSKTAKVLDLLKRPEGASMKELMKATGWQPHSVRGFLSGAIRKKMGMTVTSAKADDGERAYSIKP